MARQNDKIHSYKNAFDSFPFAILMLQRGKILYSNKNCLLIFGFESEAELQQFGFKQLFTSESYKNFQKGVRESIEDGSFTLDLVGQKKTGERVELELTFTQPEGEETGFQLLMFKDITQSKRQSVDLQKSFIQFQSLFKQNSLAMAVVRDGKIEFANGAFFKLFSIPNDTNLQDRKIEDLIDPDNQQQFQTIYKKILSGKLFQSEINYKAFRSDGVFFDVATSINLFQIGKEKNLLLHFRDVTSENQLKEELIEKASEWTRIDDVVTSLGEIYELHLLYKSLAERVTDVIQFPIYGIYLNNSKGGKLELQQSKGFSSGLLEKLSVLTLEEGIGGFLQKTLEPHVLEIEKYPSYLPFRAVFKNAGFSKICIVPFVNKANMLGAMVLATKNEETIAPSKNFLTLLSKHGGEAFARVLTFEELRKTEKDFRQSMEHTQTVLYRLSPSGIFEHFNAAIERLTGHSKREFFRTTSLWLSLIHPDDKKHLLERQTKLPELTESTSIEYRVRPKGKAQYRWVRDTLLPMKSSDGSIISFEGTMEDVTDYKHLIDEQSKVVEQKKNEQQLSNASQMLHNIIDTMEDVFILSSVDGKILQVNHAFERKFSYSFKEATRFEFPQPWLNVDETGKYVLWMSDLKKEGTLHDFDMTWKTKQGELFDMSITTTILKSPSNEPNAVVTVARDISERKRMSVELEERSHLVDLLNRIMNAAEHSTDFNIIFSKIAEEVKKIISFDDINVCLIADPNSVEVLACEGLMSETKGMHIPIELTISQFTVRGQKPVIIADMDEYPEYALLDSYNFGIRSQMSFPIVLKGRILGTLTLGSTTVNAYQDIQTKNMQLVAQQLGAIIDRVQLFNKVSEDVSYIRNLLDSIDNVVYTINKDHRILEVNRAWNEFLKAYNIQVKKEYQGLYLFDVLPDESLKLMLQKVTEDVLSGSIRFFSQEIVLQSAAGEKIYQVTINPLVIERKIMGLVISHSDVTELRHTASELKKYSDKLLTLNSIAMLIQHSRSIDEILRTALPLLQKTIEADAVVVYLKKEGTEDLTLAANSDIDKNLLEKIPRLRLSTSATGSVFKTHQPIFIQKKAYSDSRILPEFREFFKKANVEALAIIPLISREQIYGAIDIVYRALNPFTEQLTQILSLVSNQLGSAIESAQLYNQLQTQIDQLSVLYQISQHLTSTLETERIFEIVAEHVQKTMTFESLTIGLYDEQRNELITSFKVSQHAGKIQIFSEDAERKKVVIQSEEWEVVTQKKTSVNNAGKLLRIPMISKENIIGIMSLSGSALKVYSETQIRLLESIANLVAISLEKATLYQETIQKTAEIERRNKELDDFAYVVSHDLKEPLISIEGFSRILEADYDSSINEEGKEYLTSIVAASGRMKGLIDDLLMLSRISRPTEAFKPIALDEVINEIKADFVYTLIQKSALLVVEDPLPVIVGNRPHLKILFQNLISNAIKFNDKPRPIVEIGFLNTENNSYLFFVRDNGIGIDKDFYDKIFVIFQRLHPREDYEGTGAGLAIVKKIIEMHNGTIWVESTPGQGATFYFTLPK